MADHAADMLARLEAGTLEAQGFSHAAHIAVAYEALQRNTFVGAVQLISEGLQHLTRKAGAPEKFSATLTVAFMSVIAERMAVGHYNGAADFVARNGDLADRTLFTRWYSPERLASPLARQIYLMPDKGA